jgi:hypothetical protein
LHKPFKQSLSITFTEYSDINRLVSILRAHNGQNLCRAYCPKDLPKPSTSTKYTTKTITKTTSKTTTVCPKGVCSATSKVTSTAKPPPDLTNTEIATTTTDVTSTLVAETQTITTSVTNLQTTITTSTFTASVTIGPGAPAQVPSSPVRRHVTLPAYLKGWKPEQIKAACFRFVQPAPVIVTKTGIKTITSTRVSTYTQKPTTTTIVVATVTPPAVTRITVMTTTITNTVLTTSTPLTTLSTTITSTVTEASAITVTTTICAQATQGITGIAVTPPGSLRFPGAGSPEQCCAACYATPGCVSWWSVRGSICAFSIGSPPNTPPITAQCPNGLGNWSFFDGGLQDDTQLGGPGYCAGSRV